jgi:hypothetical protein
MPYRSAQVRRAALVAGLNIPFEEGPLDIEIVRPRAEGRFPVILESSPYHGTLADRDGTRILPGPKNAEGKPIGLTGYFAPRGYAVVMMDLRGTGRSQGCLDHLGPKDGRDLKHSGWHELRDSEAGATAADIPVFAVHGVNDNAARVPGLNWFFERSRPGDKLWLGQWAMARAAAPTDVGTSGPPRRTPGSTGNSPGATSRRARPWSCS